MWLTILWCGKLTARKSNFRRTTFLFSRLHFIWLIRLAPATNIHQCTDFCYMESSRRAAYLEHLSQAWSWNCKVWLIPKSPCPDLLLLNGLDFFFFFLEAACYFSPFLFFKGLIVLVPVSQKDVLQMREKDLKIVWNAGRTRDVNWSLSLTPSAFHIPQWAL